MSSTNRGAERQAADYYVTPIPAITTFLEAFERDRNIQSEKCGQPIIGDAPTYILDPSAGGDDENPMSYPAALSDFKPWGTNTVRTLDIRPDSLAEYRVDYLKDFVPWYREGHRLDLVEGHRPDLIITNPPFSLALSFITKALRDVRPDGLVIALLRLNFLGSMKRQPFWKSRMPITIYVHSERMSFWTERAARLAGKTWAGPSGVKGKTDSIEYAHFVWKQGVYPQFAQLRVI